MAGKRTFELVHTLNALDYEVETKVPGLGGPYSPPEMGLVMIGMIAVTALTILCLYPFIKGWGSLSFLIWMFLVPKAVTKLKKNKPRSWLWDIRHKWGLVSSSKQHFRRPFSTRSWVGARAVVRSSWTEPTRGGLVPIKPHHLTYGLPAIRVYDPAKKMLKSSITPQPTFGGYAIVTRRYQPGARRIPDYWRNAVVGRDESGRAAIQDYVLTYIPWKQAHV